jgi:hypothetical protein
MLGIRDHSLREWEVALAHSALGSFYGTPGSFCETPWSLLSFDLGSHSGLLSSRSRVSGYPTDIIDASIGRRAKGVNARRAYLPRPPVACGAIASRLPRRSSKLTATANGPSSPRGEERHGRQQRTNVWRGVTSPAGGLRRLMAHDGSSHMLDLRLGIRGPRQRCAADQRWPVLRPVLHEARHSRTGATDTRTYLKIARRSRSAINVG